ncbi:MAG: UvrD-helicase domain-containing protein [Alphaproteobacteria bacterium]|nr:UvrD-helicase domain-containing protein [Alphaproteobacteria bacterium]
MAYISPMTEQSAARAATPSPLARHLSGLNPVQLQAVEALDGPVLVLAGAGTGKTRVLTSRLVHLLATARAMPSQILAVTFTNKAASEMRHRVEAMLGRPVEGWWLGTFHSIGTRILRRHAELAGLRTNFTILDADDQVRLLKQIMTAEHIDDKKWPARVLMGVIQRWKDRGLLPEQVTAGEDSEVANGGALNIYRQYQDRLRTLNAVDFGDLLLLNLALFKARPDVLEDYQRRFRYILVDEYQDTNVSQYLWLRLLAQGHRNICCVGDDDQSIYGWRGAEVGNILKFEQDFPGAKVIRLEQNYRSTARILAAASGLIAHNQERLGKTLWTETRDVEPGEKLRLRSVWDGEDEARFVGEEIEALQRRKEPLSQIAILVRAGFQTREFEERLMTLGVPYRVIGGPRFYERQEIRDAMAYLRVINQPDDDLAFERIVNLPRRGIGDTTLRAAHALARAKGVSLTTACRELAQTDELKPAGRRALTGFLNDLDRWRALVDRTPHAELAEMVLEESGYVAMWRDSKAAEAPGRLDNLKELIPAMGEFESLNGFLEHVSLVMEATTESQGDMVSIMTLHAAKGLEFDTVFLPGWEEELFPNRRTLDEGGAKALEEERRLAYVGLTRARKRVIISHAQHRRVFNAWVACLPSRFIDELPAAEVELDSGPGVALRRDPALESASSWSAVPRWQQGRGFGGRSNPLLIEGTAREVDAVPTARFASGARVFHQKFGYGTVAGVDGDKLDIEFDKAGRKKVMDSFVQRATA